MVSRRGWLPRLTRESRDHERRSFRAEGKVNLYSVLKHGIFSKYQSRLTSNLQARRCTHRLAAASPRVRLCARPRESERLTAPGTRA
jgi:hypothetical protein